MQEILIALLVFGLVWLIAIAAGVLIVRARLHRQNRVAREVPTAAPIRWLWSPTSSARLHRRLQSAIWPIDPAATSGALPPAPGTDDLRADLALQATAIDHHLALVRRAPRRVRRAEVRATGQHVLQIEDLCARLAGQPRLTPPAHGWSFAPSPPVATPWPLVDLRERVQHLEAARAEVQRLEQLATHGPAWAPRPPAAHQALPASARQPASEVETLTSVSRATFAAPSSID